MRVSLSQKVFEALMNLVATRPLKEVIKLWTEVQKDMQMIEEPAKEEPASEQDGMV